MLKYLRVVFCLVAMLATQVGYGLSTPAWLYVVEVPVADQSVGERERAAQAGLLTVLTRVTGLTSIPRNQSVRRALDSAARYYDEFVFVDDDRTTEDTLALRISYQPSAVLELVRSAQLPLWWTRRPKVLAWVVVEEAGERQILDANSTHPLREALLAAGLARGLEIELPLMDLQDHLNVSSEDIWGHATQVLTDMGEKYGADINLIGRVENSLSFRGRSITGDWVFWLGDRRLEFPFTTDQYQQSVAAGVDGLADELQQIYSIAALDSQLWELRISGLRGAAPYAQLMSYLGGLDFVSHVSLKSLRGDVATVVLESPARAEQLLRLLTVEQRLAEDSLYLGTGVQLMWRG